MDKMYGGDGMSPRKAMAGGATSGDFDVKSYPGRSHTAHPDVAAKTAERGAMADGDRGIGSPIKHSGDMHPAQAAPRHGPMFEKQMGFMRAGKV